MKTGNPDNGESEPGPDNGMPVSHPSVCYPMFSYWDNQLICRFANQASLDWFAGDGASVIGNKDLRECIGDEQFNRDKLHIESVLRGKYREFERTLHKDGKPPYPALISLIPDISNGKILGFFASVSDNRFSWRRADYRLADEKNLLKAIIEIQEKERLTMADMLRDNINQLLVYVNLMMQSGTTSQEQPGSIHEMRQTLRQAIQELNKMSNRLYPSGLSLLGLLPSLENLISQYNEDVQTDLSLYCNNPEIEQLQLADKLSVFRIIQDFIGLVVPARNSKYVLTELNYRDYCLIIRIVYNGSGERPDRNSDAFRDIRSRIDLYEGKIREFHSNDEQVFIAHLVFNHG